MATKFFDKPFDEGTILKLQIYQAYAEVWIPPFLMSGHKEIFIYDFFAGAGYDENHVQGSPIQILKKIENFNELIIKQNSTINVIFNDKDQNYIKELQSNVETFIISNSQLKNLRVNKLLEIEYFNTDFEKLFQELTNEIKDKPSLVYIDQMGIKFFKEKYILDFGKMKQTDFLYFISSSFLKRFSDVKEFDFLQPEDVEIYKKSPNNYIHSIFLERIKARLPEHSDLKLYPFTIKKGANVYGIVFGSTHLLAVDKFLKIC